MREDLLVFVPQKGGNSSSVSYSMYAHGIKKEKPVYSADGKADITSLATITYMIAVPDLVEKGSRELVGSMMKKVKALFR